MRTRPWLWRWQRLVGMAAAVQSPAASTGECAAAAVAVADGTVFDCRRRARDRSGEPAVLAAVSALERRCAQIPLGAAAGRSNDRRPRRRSLGLSRGYALLEGVHVRRSEGRDTVPAQGRARELDVCELRVERGDRPTQSSRPKTACRTWRKSRRGSVTAFRRWRTAARVTTVPVPRFWDLRRLQLSTDRDPLAPHAEPLTPQMLTLKTLTDEQLLAPVRPELVNAPPRIAAPDARTRAVLGYLSANCGGCHNSESSLASLGLLLKARPRTFAHVAPRSGAGPVPADVEVADSSGARRRQRVRHTGRRRPERAARANAVSTSVNTDAAARHRAPRPRSHRSGDRLDSGSQDSPRLSIPSKIQRQAPALSAGSAGFPSDSAPVCHRHR